MINFKKLDKSYLSTTFFYLLLATDIAFIFLHILYAYTDLTSTWSFSLEADRGYAEIYQYVKEYWIAILLCFLAVRQRSLLLLGWALMFFYLLLDDSFSVHEKLGGILSQRLGFYGMFGLRAIDFGEIIVSATVGLMFFSWLFITYRKSDRTSRQTSKNLLIMLFLLAFFGIAVDLIHIAVPFRFLQNPLAILEDGGELLVMSVITSFVFYLPRQLHPRNNKQLYVN